MPLRATIEKVRLPQLDGGEEGSPDCQSAGRLGDGPELEVEGEAGVEVNRAHGFQFDVPAGAQKTCDGHRCGRVCSEERGNRGEIPSSNVVCEGASFHFRFHYNSSISSLESRRVSTQRSEHIEWDESALREGNRPFH
jgi:hypothetical protein